MTLQIVSTVVQWNIGWFIEIIPSSIKCIFICIWKFKQNSTICVFDAAITYVPSKIETWQKKTIKKRLKYGIHQPLLLNISIEMWSWFWCYPHPNTMILHLSTLKQYSYKYYILFSSFWVETKVLGTGDYSFDWHSVFHWDGKSFDLAKLNGDIWTDFHRSQRKRRPFDKRMVYHEIQFLPQPMPCGKNEIRFVCVFFLYWSFSSCQLPVSCSYKHFTWKCKLKIRLCVCGLFDCVFQHQIMCFTYGLRLASNIVGSY